MVGEGESVAGGLALSKAYFKLGGVSVICSYILRHCSTRLQIIWEDQEWCPLSFVKTVSKVQRWEERLSKSNTLSA